MEEEVESKEKNNLSYDTMVKISINCNRDNTKIVEHYEDQPYGFRDTKSGFFEIYKNPTPDDYDNKYGLKFHISLPEFDYLIDGGEDKEKREYYKKGWDVIKQVLIKYEVNLFKICDDTLLLSKEDIGKGEGVGSQRGKDVTIYASSNASYKDKEWKKIIYEITENLIDAGIPPGYKTKREGDRADNTLEGNNYVSYRYEIEAPKKDYFAEKIKWPKGQLDNIKWAGEDNTLNNNNNNSCCNCTIL